jgi:hypothetical protein
LLVAAEGPGRVAVITFARKAVAAELKAGFLMAIVISISLISQGALPNAISKWI